MNLKNNSIKNKRKMYVFKHFLFFIQLLLILVGGSLLMAYFLPFSYPILFLLGYLWGSVVSLGGFIMYPRLFK